MKIWCPRCNQGWVIDLYIPARNMQLVRVCEECEALWLDNQPVSVTHFLDMQTYLQSLGLKGEWSELRE